jgi:hypothetical protein
MSDLPFNGLRCDEAERLVLLSEEAAEVIQAVGKILRHGYEDINPDKPADGDNRTQLEMELGDFAYARRLMLVGADLDVRTIKVAAGIAAEAKPKWLHHQPVEFTEAVKAHYGVECDHQWVVSSAPNIVQGEWCHKCGKLGPNEQKQT